MLTWYDVIEPHEDIKKGNFDEAIFAAKLGDVALGKAVVDYNEPSLFFKKTYFTDGKTRNPHTRSKTFQGIAEAMADQWG